jgi:hypothetical protein
VGREVKLMLRPWVAPLIGEQAAIDSVRQPPLQTPPNVLAAEA